MRSVPDLGALAGKRVLIRCDFNVPLDGDVITDDGRIRAALPTLTGLLKAGAKVVVLAHLGRPKGLANPKYSLAPAAKRLGLSIDRRTPYSLPGARGGRCGGAAMRSPAIVAAGSAVEKTISGSARAYAVKRKKKPAFLAFFTKLNCPKLFWP